MSDLKIYSTTNSWKGGYRLIYGDMEGYTDLKILSFFLKMCFKKLSLTKESLKLLKVKS